MLFADALENAILPARRKEGQSPRLIVDWRD